MMTLATNGGLLHDLAQVDWLIISLMSSASATIFLLISQGLLWLRDRSVISTSALCLYLLPFCAGGVCLAFYVIMHLFRPGMAHITDGRSLDLVTVILLVPALVLICVYEVHSAFPGIKLRRMN